MFLKLLVVAVVFVVLFMPRALPRLLRRLGRSVRGTGQAVLEVTSGEEQPGSPLAKLEVQAGEVVRARIEASARRCEEPALVERVGAIGQRLAKGAARKRIPYRFHVLEDRTPNAFAVPGGTIYVTTGLVDLCDRGAGADDRLAGVIGHEVAHVELRHAAKRMATQAAMRTGSFLVFRTKAVLLQQAAGTVEELLSLGHGREREYEADALGARLAARAGFRREGLSELLGRLSELAPADDEGFLAYFDTHPAFASRIERLDRSD